MKTTEAITEKEKKYKRVLRNLTEKLALLYRGSEESNNGLFNF